MQRAPKCANTIITKLQQPNELPDLPLFIFSAKEIMTAQKLLFLSQDFPDNFPRTCESGKQAGKTDMSLKTFRAARAKENCPANEKYGKVQGIMDAKSPMLQQD